MENTLVNQDRVLYTKHPRAISAITVSIQLPTMNTVVSISLITTFSSVTDLRVALNITSRVETVAILVKLLEEYTIVHVKGTTASGKSWLAHLLKRCY